MPILTGRETELGIEGKSRPDEDFGGGRIGRCLVAQRPTGVEMGDSVPGAREHLELAIKTARGYGGLLLLADGVFKAASRWLSP